MNNVRFFDQAKTDQNKQNSIKKKVLVRKVIGYSVVIARSKGRYKLESYSLRLLNELHDRKGRIGQRRIFLVWKPLFCLRLRRIRQ